LAGSGGGASQYGLLLMENCNDDEDVNRAWENKREYPILNERGSGSAQIEAA